MARQSPKTPSWEKKAGFAFGVIFITAIFLAVLFIPVTSPEQTFVFRTILALAAAGVGGVLLGRLDLKGSMNKWTIRAGGALAIFVIVYMFSPGTYKVSMKAIGDNADFLGINFGHVYMGNSEPNSETEEQ